MIITSYFLLAYPNPMMNLKESRLYVIRSCQNFLFM